MNPTEDLTSHKFKSNEAKIFRPKYDTVSGGFLGLVEILGYLTIRGGSTEYFFDYGYSKENSKVLYNHYKIKLPNSFSGTMFNWDRVQYESGTLDIESSKIYFFLPSTTDKIEEINGYMNSVNLVTIDIHQNKFEVDGGNFDPSKLDFDNPDREKTREAVLRVSIQKTQNLSNSNLQKNADVCLLVNVTIKIFYASETVKNAFLKMYLLFPIKFKEKKGKKKCSFQFK